MFGECCDNSRRGAEKPCLRCSWTIGDAGAQTIYAANTVIAASGSVAVSAGSNGNLTVRFLYRHIVVGTLPVRSGAETAFSMAGFDRIEIATDTVGLSEGELRLYPSCAGDF